MDEPLRGIRPQGHQTGAWIEILHGGAVEAPRQAAIKSALDRAQAEADFSAYLESIKRSSKVTLYKDRLEKKPN